MELEEPKDKIPKIIHYCWFGPNKMSSLEKKCLASWKEHLPDYKVMKWDESTVELNHPFLQYAYTNQKWAFVADYVRLQKVYEFGGIYLDTDMMLLKPLDSFLNIKSFFGAEDENFINAGIFGSVKKHPFLLKCLFSYNIVEKPLDWFAIAIPKIITQNFRLEFSYYKDFNTLVKVENCTVFPPQFFYPLQYNSRADNKNFSKYVLEESYAVHLWRTSWIELNEFQYFRKGEFIKGLRKVLKTLCSKRQLHSKYIRKNLSAIKESFSNGTWKI